MYDEIKQRDSSSTHVGDPTTYSHTWGSHSRAVMDRRHLIKMVEALAGAAGHNGRCPFDWYATKRGATLEDIAFCDTVSCEQTREERTECWFKWADKKAEEK
jgi:hypothetical protein